MLTASTLVAQGPGLAPAQHATPCPDRGSPLDLRRARHLVVAPLQTAFEPEPRAHETGGHVHDHPHDHVRAAPAPRAAS